MKKIAILGMLIFSFNNISSQNYNNIKWLSECFFIEQIIPKYKSNFKEVSDSILISSNKIYSDDGTFYFLFHYSDQRNELIEITLFNTKDELIANKVVICKNANFYWSKKFVLIESYQPLKGNSKFHIINLQNGRIRYFELPLMQYVGNDNKEIFYFVPFFPNEKFYNNGIKHINGINVHGLQRYRFNYSKEIKLYFKSLPGKLQDEINLVIKHNTVNKYDPILTLFSSKYKIFDFLSDSINKDCKKFVILVDTLLLLQRYELPILNSRIVDNSDTICILVAADEQVLELPRSIFIIENYKISHLFNVPYGCSIEQIKLFENLLFIKLFKHLDHEDLWSILIYNIEDKKFVDGCVKLAN